MKDEFDGFSINMFLDEKNDWVAYFVERPSISAFGKTTSSAINELKKAWSLVKESCISHGIVLPTVKQYSGKFNIRVDKRLHKQLTLEAARTGVSLNAIICQKLNKDKSNFI